jgi:DNA-binding transcriptional LysR family regulator
MSVRPNAALPNSASPELSRVSWDDLKLFAVATDTPSLRQAAKLVGLDVSTMSRHIDRLEDSLGVTLFDRLPRGLELTSDGERVLTVVRRMRGAAQEIARKVDEDRGVEGIVTCQIADELTHFWVMPLLKFFNAVNPQIQLDIQAGPALGDRTPPDILVGFEEPKYQDWVTRRLGNVHYNAFAAPRYLAQNPLPTGTSWRGHKFVVQTGMPQPFQALPRWLSNQGDGAKIVLTTASPVLHHATVKNGVAIGLLPSFLIALGEELVPVDIPLGASRRVHLSYRRDGRKKLRVALFIDWLTKLFGDKRHVWFGEKAPTIPEIQQKIPLLTELNPDYIF